MPENQVSVSVVIPTYNRARFIGEALESVFAQTYSDYEVIVVDDGSRDDTRNALEPWLERIHYIYQTNRGGAAARNRGIKEAMGEWVAFLDSDDRWEPKALETLHRTAATHPEAGLIAMRARKLYPDGTVSRRTVGKKSAGERFTSRSLLWGDSGIMTPMVRRSLLMSLGGLDESLTSAEDSDMWLRLSFHTTLIGVPEPLLLVRVHPGNLSRDKAENSRMWIKILEKLAQEQPEFVKNHPWVYRRALGKERLRRGRELLARSSESPSLIPEARTTLGGSVRTFPFFARAWIYWTTSYVAPRRYATWRRFELRWRR